MDLTTAAKVVGSIAAPVSAYGAIPAGAPAQCNGVDWMPQIVYPYTTAARDALTMAASMAGSVIRNSTTNKLNTYSGAAWEAVTSA